MLSVLWYVWLLPVKLILFEQEMSQQKVLAQKRVLSKGVELVVERKDFVYPRQVMKPCMEKEVGREWISETGKKLWT